MFFRIKKSGPREYLQIAHNRREQGKVKQDVIATVGRLDVLKADGSLEGLLRSGAKFSEKLVVLDESSQGKSISTKDSIIGLPIIFDRLWKEAGIKTTIEKYVEERKFRFPVERAIYLTVLHRLSSPGSDRAAEKWKNGYKIEGTEDINLHHLYRAMAWLGEELPEGHQKGATPFAPRCTKDLIEEDIFHKSRDLFGDLTLVFFDTTSIYFEGEGGEDLGAYGHSKDHRPDLKQMVVGIAIDNTGRPICCELWPGNTADVKTLIPIIDRLRIRFGIQKICIVADRGMISKENIGEIEGNPKMQYILGVRMRRVKEVREDVLSYGGKYEEVYAKSPDSKAPSPLKVKEVTVKGKRYIICVNEDQAKKDALDRDKIIVSLREKLKRGDKSLVGNKGYRKYLKNAGKHFDIDEDKIKKDIRYDGKWVLTTNTAMSARETALQYKELWMVEQIFRTMKTILTTRPIYHKCDETIRGHVFCSFLSLLLIKQLQQKMSAKGRQAEWADVINDLEALKETIIETGDKEITIRSEIKGEAGKTFQAVGVAVPQRIKIAVKNENAKSA
jgi:transposase